MPTHKINRKFFFDNARSKLFGGKLTTGQVNGLNAILDEWEKNYANNDDRWLAYMLATAHHETDRKMAGIEEYKKGVGRPYGKRLKVDGKTGYTDTPNIFYGRGLVQLTWYENYKKAGTALGIDLIQNADKALELPIAVQIMFKGMTLGWFTGVKLSTYFDATKDNWVGARKIINGTDKANTIAEYGKSYYACISYLTV